MQKTNLLNGKLRFSLPKWNKKRADPIEPARFDTIAFITL
jgi:hypothetical protein